MRCPIDPKHHDCVALDLYRNWPNDYPQSPCDTCGQKRINELENKIKMQGITEESNAKKHLCYKTVKKSVKYYEKMTGHKPPIIHMSREFYGKLKEEITEKWPCVKDTSPERETIFGIPIEVVDEYPPT